MEIVTREELEDLRKAVKRERNVAKKLDLMGKLFYAEREVEQLDNYWETSDDSDDFQVV